MDTATQIKRTERVIISPSAANECEKKAFKKLADRPNGTDAKIVALVGGGPLPRIMVNSLIERFGPITILEEDKEPLSIMVRRRVKLLGVVETVGQVAFGIWLKLLHKLSSRRKQELLDHFQLNAEQPSNCQVINIGDVNSELCRAKLRQLDPKVVVVIGTRMIKSETLNAIDAIFMNYHAGLNPKYRGMNGGYWALANGDSSDFGVTMHVVDEGVDTGSIISYKTLKVTRRDNFTTYPLLQATAGRNLLLNAVQDALDGNLITFELPLESKQWFHPTLWSYLRTGLRTGVW